MKPNANTEPSTDLKNNQIEKFGNKLDTVRGDVHELQTSMSFTSIRISGIEREIKVMKADIADLDKKVDSINLTMKESFTNVNKSFAKISEQLEKLEKLNLLDQILTQYEKDNTDREVHAQHHHDINDRIDGHDKRIILLETVPKAA